MQVFADGSGHHNDEPTHELIDVSEEQLRSYARGRKSKAKSALVSDGPWTFKIGKHKGLTVAEVKDSNPSYFTWILRKCIHLKWVGLKEEMDACGLLPADAPTVLPAEDAPQPERLRRQQAHDKYVPRRQRAQFYDKVTRRINVNQTVSLWEIARASPMDLSWMLLQWQFLDKVEGTACQTCLDGDEGEAKRRFPGCQGQVYGKMTCEGESSKVYKALAEEAQKNISRSTAMHRCLVCRGRTTVANGNRCVPVTTSKSLSLTMQVAIQWCVVDGMTDAQISRTLNLGRNAVRKYGDFGRFIMYTSVLKQQESMKFGGLPDGWTTVVEADETDCGHWEAVDVDGAKVYGDPGGRWNTAGRTARSTSLASLA